MATASRHRLPARLRAAAAMTPGRAALGLLLLLALGFYLVNATHFAGQPLRIEENEWPRMAKAIHDTGRPFISAAESQRLRLDPSVAPGEPLRWTDEPFIGAWHPPLYQYVSAIAMVGLGTDASYALRGIGIAAMLLGCLLLFLIAREVDARRWPVIGTAAAVLLLVHPYAIQGSTFLDIDTGLYVPVILLLMWLAVRFVKRPERLGPRAIGLLAFALALVCWTKLTTVIVLAPALVLFWLLSRGLRRGLPEAVAMIAGGAALFFSTYALWCVATDIPFSYTFDVTFEQKKDRLGGTPEQREWVFRWQVAWFLPALFMLAAAYGIDAVYSFLRTRRARPMDLLWGSGVAVLINYAVVAPSPGIYQGKYALPALPLLILPVAWMCLRGVNRVPSVPVLAVAIGVAVVAAVNMPDLTTENSWLAQTDSWRDAIVMGTALALLAAWRLVPRAAGLAAGPLIVLAALSLAQSVHSADADTSPLHPIRDTEDFNAVVAATNRALAPGDIALVSKDIGFYVKPYAKVVEGHDTIYRGDELTARMIREDPKVTVWAGDTFGPPLGPAISGALEECFANIENFGTAQIRTRSKLPC